MQKYSIIYAVMINCILLFTVANSNAGSFIEEMKKASDSFKENVMRETKGVVSKSGDDDRNGKEEQSSKLPITDILTPFNESLPKNKQFPRVAVTVLKAPSNHQMGFKTTFPSSTKIQYLLQARIWKNKDTFFDTEEFTWDLIRDGVFQFPMASYQQWAFFTLSREDTGMNRTKGPLNPKTPLPNDRKHKRFFGAMYPRSVDYFMMSSLAYAAGIEPETHDQRFWIVEFKDAL